MADIDRQAFAVGVNEAIGALRALYGGVRTLFDELKMSLKDGPNPLHDFDVRIKPLATRLNPDERFLRTWEGRFYSVQEPPEDDGEEDEGGDDDDVDEEPRKRKFVTLNKGQDIAFVKVVIYHRAEVEEGEPHVLAGAMRRIHAVEPWEELKARTSSLRKLLELVRDGMPVGEIQTRASVMWPDRASRSNKNGNRLVVRIDEPPLVWPLFEIRTQDQLRVIATQLKALWQSGAAPDA